jgi:hypothetical protein
VLTLHPLLYQEHLTSLREDRSSPQAPAALQIALREVQAPYIMSRKAKYKEEDGHLSTSTLPPQTSLTGNITPSFMEKSQALIDLSSLSSRLTNSLGQTVDSSF